MLVEPWIREALIRLNPEITANPELVDQVLYKLRAIVLAVRTDGLVRSNEEMTAWLRGERSMPFGQNNEHVPVHLIDFENLDDNQYVVTQQFTYRAGAAERRPDLVLIVNGFPLVLIEAKTPVAFFPGVDRAVEGYDGLIAAQQCLPNNTVRDNFAGEYSVANKLWEAISPDAILGQYEKDYRWLSQVYQSVQPSSGHGKLIWHSLGAKTIELIHENVHVGAVRDDLDTLVLDADLLEAVLSNPDPKKTKEIEIKVARRLQKHLGNPKFKALSERLDALKERFEAGLVNSVEFLKQLLQLAKEVLQAEQEIPPEEDEDRGKAALTDLFNDVKTAETPIMVERVVTDIDDIVRLVRFPGWQNTLAGEREIKKALRKTLFKYKLHADEDLFEKAFGYIRQYY